MASSNSRNYFDDDLEDTLDLDDDYRLQTHRRCLGPLPPYREMIIRRPEAEPLGAGRINIDSKCIN